MAECIFDRAYTMCDVYNVKISDNVYRWLPGFESGTVKKQGIHVNGASCTKSTEMKTCL